MTSCPACRQEVPHEKFGLRAFEQPRSVYFRAERLNLSPTQAGMLGLLIRRSEVSVQTLWEQFCGAEAGRGVASVQLCKLREKLREAGVPVAIETLGKTSVRLAPIPAVGASRAAPRGSLQEGMNA